jgi:peroxiredoxin
VVGRSTRQSLVAVAGLVLVLLAGAACAAGRADPVTEPPAAAGLDPPFTLPTVDGGSFASTALAGQPAVLWFWAPWCPTCVRQARHVRAAAEASAGKVAVIGIAGLGEIDAMREFVRMTKVSGLTHLADVDGVVWKRFGIVEQSLFVLLDRTGRVVYSGRIDDGELAARVATLAGPP